MSEWKHPYLTREQDLERLLCIREATQMDRPYDERLARIAGLTDLTQAGDRTSEFCPNCSHPTGEHKVLLATSGYSHCRHQDCICAVKTERTYCGATTGDLVCKLPATHQGNMHSTQPDEHGAGLAWPRAGSGLDTGVVGYTVVAMHPEPCGSSND